MKRILKKILLIFTISIVALGMMMVMVPGALFGEAGGVTVEKKLLDGSTPASGTFQFVVKSGSAEITYDLNSGNGYSVLVPLVSTQAYEIWEVESTLPTSHQFVRIDYAGQANNVSIGTNSTILPVTISDNVVIGAGSVVTKDIKKPGIYAGNPARKIRQE